MKSNRNPLTRTPSQLYHHVFTSTPINNDQFGIQSSYGPEFVVRSRDDSKEIQLKALASEKVKNLRTVLVILLSGHRIILQCNPLVNTLEQIYEAVINDQQIKFAHFLSLAFMCNGEFHFPDLKTKIHKVAPPGWDNNKNTVVLQKCTLYLRFLCYPRIDNPRYLPSSFANMLYLQLRQDFIEGKIHTSMPTMLSLASLTLQVEFGHVSKEQAENRYFLLEHYLPEYAHGGDEKKESALEMELIQLHRSLKLSPEIAKEQYITGIHGTSSYGNLIYHFFEHKYRKSQFLVVTPAGLTVLLESASLDRISNEDIIKWSVVKKIKVSDHRLTVSFNSKPKVKKIKMLFTENKDKHVLNVCVTRKRFHDKHSCLASDYFENSINTSGQKHLSKSSSEMNLYRSNGITTNPDATPCSQNCDNENNRGPKAGLSSSCLNLSERGDILPRRRLCSVYYTSGQGDSKQYQAKDPRAFSETTEYPDFSGNSLFMKKQSPKPNVVTYFPSLGNSSPVKAINGGIESSHTTTPSGSSPPENNLAPNIDAASETDNNLIDFPSEKTTVPNLCNIGNSHEKPVVDVNVENGLGNVSIKSKKSLLKYPIVSGKKSLVEIPIDSPIASPNGSPYAFPFTDTTKLNEKPLKRSVTSAGDSPTKRYHLSSSHELTRRSSGHRSNSTIVKVTSFRETSEPRSHGEPFLRKRLGHKIVLVEDLSDSDHSPNSSPKKSSIGVKMGTKVTTAILQKHKLSRPGQSPYSEDIHNPIVIEPDVANCASPIRGPEESVNESLVNRFLAAPSPEYGLADRKLITVSLTRSEGNLGITLHQAADGSLYICEIIPGKPASNNGVLKEGDRLMGVNGFSVENLSCERALSLLKSSDPVQLLVSQPIHKYAINDESVGHETPKRGNNPPPRFVEKHVTIIKVSSVPSSCDHYSETSLSPSEPISV